MNIQEIESKISLFEDSLKKSFVPDDEKAYYRLAIEKLQAQKAQLMKGGSATASAHIVTKNVPVETVYASPQQDTSELPDGSKKKSLQQMLVVWKERMLKLLKKIGI